MTPSCESVLAASLLAFEAPHDEPDASPPASNYQTLCSNGRVVMWSNDRSNQ